MVDTIRVDKITGTNRTSTKEVFFSDFYTNFNKHPESNFLVKATNEESIKKALRNLLLTDKGERLYQPNLGGNINSLLFEDISEFTANQIKSHIADSIKYFEPRVNVLDIAVIPNESKNSYEVAILFEVINSVQPTSIALTLYRVR